MTARFTDMWTRLAGTKEGGSPPPEEPGRAVTWPPPWLHAAQRASGASAHSGPPAWPPPWLEAVEERAGDTPRPGRSSQWTVLELDDEREGDAAAATEQRERAPSAERRNERTEQDGAGGAINRLLLSEELAILDLIEDWGSIDRSARRLAHRGSSLGTVFVSPTTVQRVAAEHRIALPRDPPRPHRRRIVVPDVPWERNRIWIWEYAPFPTAALVAHTIVDLVTRYWLGYLLSSEQSWSQVRTLYASALSEQGLERDDGPILVAWSEESGGATRAGGPTRRVQIESFFGHLSADWPELTLPTDPDTLDQELARVRGEYNALRLHPAIGYITPSDEHHGRGPEIRAARDAGLRDARAERIRHNRRSS